jgi:hypothetical protein
MKRITLILAIALAGCATTQCPTSATPCPAPADCSSACLHGSNLGCEWATPTPAGGTCLQVCENATASGVPWNVIDLTAVTSCQP